MAQSKFIVSLMAHLVFFLRRRWLQFRRERLWVERLPAIIVNFLFFKLGTVKFVTAIKFGRLGTALKTWIGKEVGLQRACKNCYLRSSDGISLNISLELFIRSQKGTSLFSNDFSNFLKPNFLNICS